MNRTKKITTGAILLMSCFLFFVMIKPAHAIEPLDTLLGWMGSFVLTILGWAIQFFVYVIGKLVVMVISMLITVASWQDFIHVPLVIDGWVIIRDLCNMFFILVLLVIAFATILHLQNYSIKQLFKRVIVFAILINFSRLICGVMIDFAQVIMLTFVNAFKDIGAGNFTALLGINDLLSIDPDTTDKVDNWSIAGSYLLALLYVIVMLIVMLAFLFTLAFRVIMLWIYIILSPLAYLASIVPFGSGIAKNWWSSFTNNVVSGPLLAFFIWLSLASLGSFSDLDSNNEAWYKYTNLNTPRSERNLSPKESPGPVVGITQAGSAEHMLRFVISISLLIGGLMVTKSLSGGAGGAAGWGFGMISGGASFLKRKSIGLAKKGGKWAGRKTWSGAKKAGRVGLGLAASVDKAASKGLYKVAGSEYKADQGLLTRGATSVKHNVFSKEGWQKNLRRFVYDPNHSRERAAAQATGSHIDEKGRKFEKYYDEQTKKTNYRTKTKNADGTYTYGDYWEHDGKKVEEMSDFGATFHKTYHAMKGTAEGDKARIAAEKEAVKKYGEPYKDSSKEELHMLARGTSDPNKLKGIGAILAEKGEFIDKDVLNKVKDAFGDNILQLKDFLKNLRTKQAHFATDFSKESEVAALGVAIKKGKVKMSDQNLATLEKDKTEDMDMVANITEVFRNNLHKERWSAEIGKIDKEGDPDVADKWSRGLGVLSNRKEAEYDRTRDEVANLQHTADLYTSNANQPNISAQAKEFYQAMADQARQERVSVENKARLQYGDVQSLRVDRLTLDLDGDPIKAFANANGTTDYEMMKNFFSKASVKQISQVNPEKVSQDKRALQAMAEGITFEKLKGLNKSGNNPGLVREIAQTMADINHPDADKIAFNFANDIDVDLKATGENDFIRNFMRQNKMKGSDNLVKINEIRPVIADAINQARTVNPNLSDNDKDDIARNVIRQYFA